MRSTGRSTATQGGNGSFLEQFITAEKAPLDAETDNLADNTVKLINTLWKNPLSRAEIAEIYTTLPRTANAEALHKTRMNPELEPTLNQRVKDNDTTLAATQCPPTLQQGIDYLQ